MVFVVDRGATAVVLVLVAVLFVATQSPFLRAAA